MNGESIFKLLSLVKNRDIWKFLKLNLLLFFELEGSKMSTTADWGQFEEAFLAGGLALFFTEGYLDQDVCQRASDRVRPLNLERNFKLLYIERFFKT